MKRHYNVLLKKEEAEEIKDVLRTDMKEFCLDDYIIHTYSVILSGEENVSDTHTRFSFVLDDDKAIFEVVQCFVVYVSSIPIDDKNLWTLSDALLNFIVCVMEPFTGKTRRDY